MKSHEMVSTAHDAVAWSQEESERAAQGDADDIHHSGTIRGPSRATWSTQLQLEHLPLLPWEVGIHLNLRGSHFKELNLDIIIIFFSLL